MKDSYNIFNVLFDPDLMQKATKITEKFFFEGRERYFQNEIKTSKETYKCLKQYLDFLMRQVKKRMSQHSKYSLIYYFRRILSNMLQTYDNTEWKQEEIKTFKTELLWFVWFSNRITLAAIKYGRSSLDDLQNFSFKHKGFSEYIELNQLTSKYSVDLHVTLSLMWEWDKIRYCMKRLARGGKFIWRNRNKFEFDIIMEPNIKNLVNIFDTRVNSTDNLLNIQGSWAPMITSFEFPLPSSRGIYKPLHIWPKAFSINSGALSYYLPIVLTLLPNISNQGSDLGWRDPTTNQLIPSPSWIFHWYRLDFILPRIELFRGVIKKYLEFSGRTNYEPEDLILTLSAITQYSINAGLNNDKCWYQIFSYGYSIWNDPYELLKHKVLPEYRNLKKISLGKTSSKGDWESLKSVIEDIKWNEIQYKNLNILRYSPINLILPIDKNIWLIDWSLMLHVILDLTKSYGRIFGTVAILKGFELERTLSEYFKSNFQTLGISLWWLGQGAKNKIRFHAGGVRDIDIGIIVDDHLLILEVKAYSGRWDLYLNPDPNMLKKRWEKKIKPAINQVDTLSERLSIEIEGKNFKIPCDVRWVVPIVCSPFVEWIPSYNQKWWLYKNIPRVCTPDEIFEIIEQIKKGNSPNYKLPVARTS
ncbi:MAG: hypothetical protein APR63_07020 [Desulfuromonas sp. SDB]|nr:MAG: hypothetical protein APR63_07020 [Desulfuromonas sp. SDB]